MENKFSFAAVGVFVMGFFVILLTLIVWLTVGTNKVTYLPYQVVTNESVSGLSVNSIVDYKGVSVGVVSKIELNDLDPRFVIISLNVMEGTPIKADTIAVLTSRGITGLVNVSLQGGTESSPDIVPTEKNPVPKIINGPSLASRLDTAFNEITHTMADLSKKIDLVITTKNGERINKILENVEVITTTLADSSGDIKKITSDAAEIMDHIEPKLNKAFDSLATITDNVRNTSEGLQTTLSKADTTLDSWDQTAIVYKNLGTAVRSQVPNLNSTFTELNTVLHQVSQLLNQLKNHPNSLIMGKGKPKPGPGE